MFATVFDTLPVFYLMALSGLFCLPIFALSMVNFGLLSIWLNATVAVVVAVHHIVLIAVIWTSHKYRQSTKVIIDDEEQSPLHDATDEVHLPSAYSFSNIAFLVFLVILNAIAFSIMVDITTRGGMKSTLPAERVGHKWNLKVQIGQTSLLGVELLTLSSLLAFCCFGRARLIREANNRKEEQEY